MRIAVDYIPPTFEAVSFHCPHCNVYAHQKWFLLTVSSREPIRKTMVISDSYIDADEAPQFTFKHSRCIFCGEVAIWYKGSMIFPAASIAPHPSPDMPQDVGDDFNEAREVLSKSPRSSAALLRLAIEKLCKHLGQSGKDLNSDIKGLVKAGLPIQIQQALDTVRVIGNSAVHAGEIDLRDDQRTALTLFKLVNLIVEDRITRPREFDEIYNTLPKSKLEQISQRDQTP